MRQYKNSQPRLVYMIAFIVIYFAVACMILERMAPAKEPEEKIPVIRVIFEER